ncbi:probable calcium-binding protein CML32 [Benincasa hispida]|uniref:probable calcium-binding protein CML32 n=1 Tax=Benincasa hispida TaxID=102211 RepID=UPI001900911C|nr:probable calcium-binding protein CML32 [Benincasa hispida]
MTNKGRSVLSLFTSCTRKRQPKNIPSSTQIKQRSNSSSTSSKHFRPNLEEIKWAFEKFDSNKDGKISFEEYQAAHRGMAGSKEISDEEAAKSFKFVDVDGDGFVDLKEFLELYTMSGGEVRVGDIKSAFQVYDSNGDGKISAEEVMAIMNTLGERTTLKACKQMVKGVDIDGDGFIDIDEFSKLMGTYSSKFQN